MVALVEGADTGDAAYRAIFEASSDGLVINDPDSGVVLAANPAFCEMHGYARMVGLHPRTFIHPDSHPLFAEYMRAIREGREFRTRARDVRRDGSLFDVEVLGRGFTYQGRPAVLGVVRDVTQQVRAYEDLEHIVAARTREIERRRQVAEALSELLAIVNSRRDLNDMLSAILAQAARLLGSDAEGLYLLDDASSTLRLQASRNLPPEGELARIGLGTPVVGLAAERLKPVIAFDITELLEAPLVATVEEQIHDRGAYIELVRRGPALAADVDLDRRNRIMAARFRSLLGFPLVAREHCYGSLLLAYADRHEPSDEEFSLMRTFAGQAGLAIETARLQDQAERRSRDADRRRKVAEGLRSLVATVNSAPSLEEVLQEIAVQASRLLESDASAIYLPDSGAQDEAVLRTCAVSGLDPTYASFSIPAGVSATGLAFEQGRSVAIYDTIEVLPEDPDLDFAPVLEDRGSHLRAITLPTIRGPSGPGSDRARRLGAYAAGYRGLLAVPLAVKTETYGALTLYFREAREFDNELIALATAFADQAALAIENARVHAASEQRRSELEALYHADSQLYRSLRLNDVLQALVDEATRVLGIDRSSVLAWDDAHQRLSVRAAHGFDPSQLAHMSFAPGEGVSGQVAVTGQAIAVQDVRTDARIPPAMNRVLNADNAIRSLISVPIELDGEVFGVFNAHTAHERSFSHDQQRVLVALAQRAALAIQNARLHEQSEQRRQELEALYQADQALHRSLRLEEVLDALIDLPVALGQAEMVSLLLWDHQRDHFVVGGVRGLSDAMLEETFTRAEVRIPREDAAAQIAEVDDAATDGRLSDRLRATIVREGVGAWISSPIRIAGHLFGSLSFGFGQPHQFVDRERRLLVALAQRAAIAIQNARLHEASELQRQELQALYDADEALHRSLRLQDVLEALVDAAMGLLHADGVGLWGIDPRHPERSEPLAWRGLSDGYVQATQHIDDPALIDFWWGRDMFAVEDVLTDSSLPASQRIALEQEGCRSLLSTRIDVAGSAFGSFTVGHRVPHTFTDQERRLLTALAQRAGLAIQNARLYEQAQQVATLEERQRLARELHDAVTQTLFSTALLAEVLPDLWDMDPAEGRQRLGELRRLTRGALAEMRSLLVELRPAALTELALGDLLRQLAEATAGRSRVEVSTHVSGRVRPLPASVHVALYRLAQEALNNVVKHARARTAAVDLEYEPDRVCMRVQDDGCGFDKQQPAGEPGHFGLGIMSERAASVGAQLTIESTPAAGTRVEVVWHEAEAVEA